MISETKKSNYWDNNATIAEVDSMKARSWENSKPKFNIGIYPNGKPQWIIKLNAKQQRHGIARTYFIDGRIRTVVKYESGKMDGELKSYYQDGNPAYTKIYSNGVKTSETNY